MVLTFTDDSMLAEDIFGPFVVHHLDSVESTSLRSHGTLVSVSSLFHLETLGENVDD